MSSPRIDGDIEDADDTLYACATNCIKLFSKLVLLETEQAEDGESWAEDQCARFRLWAVNLGVLAVGRTSFDHRLQETPEILEVVNQLLKALEANLVYRKDLIVLSGFSDARQ
jgi:hypothetical protein